MAVPAAENELNTDPELLKALTDVEGWFSPDQVARAATRATAVPADGNIVEIGSFRGRSMIAMSKSAPDSVTIYAIDPHAGNDRGPQEIEGFAGEAAEDSEIFQANLEKAGVRERVTYLRKFSHDAHDDVDGQVDLLHIDGAHRFGPARSDIVNWGARVKPGGAMLIHDSFSSVGVTLAIVTSLTFNGRWRYVGRSRSLAEFRAEELSGADRVKNIGRQLAQLPWFTRNVLIKALTVVRLKSVTRLLGHDGSPWPY